MQSFGKWLHETRLRSGLSQEELARHCGVTGSFFFSVNDLAIDPGQVASITGQLTGVQQTTILELVTMILFGMGLAGIAAWARRRRKG